MLTESMTQKERDQYDRELRVKPGARASQNVEALMQWFQLPAS